MKKQSTLKLFALVALLSSAPQLYAQESKYAPSASTTLYDFSKFGDKALLDLFYQAKQQGRRFPTKEEIKNAGLTEELEFVRSHVRKREIMSRADRLLPDTYEKRDLFMNIPTGAGTTVGGYPTNTFASDTYSMWNYTNLFGAWNHGLFQAPGSWADAAHKNGTDMMSGIKFFDTTGNPGGVDASGWMSVLRTKDGDEFKYAEPLISLLQYLGLDGINYNWEASGYSDRTVIDFHQKLYAIAKERGFNNFHIAIYTSNSALTDGDAEGLFGKDGKKTTDLMLNYSGGDFSYQMASSVATAKRAMNTTEGLYAGVWIVTMNRSWTRLNQGDAKECGICLWGEHGQSRFWSYNVGGDPNELMTNYQALLERGFSGGNRNPAQRPAVQNRGIEWESNGGQLPLAKFAGLATWIPERSTIKGNLPFSTHFNLGAGSQYQYKGKKSAGSWYNMANQDLVPTYRWLVYNGNTTSASTAIQPEFTFTDAYMGGSCLQLTGTKQESATDVVLYKTDLQGSAGNIVAKVAIKSGKQGTNASNLFLLVHLKNANTWQEYDLGNTENAQWVEKTINLSDISSGTVIDKLGLRVKNVNDQYKMLVGKLQITDDYSVRPEKVKDLTLQVKEETKTSLSVKASWAVDHNEGETGLVYNDDANIDHFEVLYKTGENGKVKEVARTTQWAALIGNITLENASDKPFIGVRAVSKDLKTYSPVVWQEVARAAQDQLPEAEKMSYGTPELDMSADGVAVAQRIRYVAKVTTTGGTKNINYSSNKAVGGTNYLDASALDGGTLEVEQGKEVTLVLKGYEATPAVDGSRDDLRYCFGRAWIDLDSDHQFKGGLMSNGGEECFTIGELRKGVTQNVNPGQTVKFTIPQDARTGESRLRIVFSDAWFQGALQPVGKFNKGCAIDFKVVITGNNNQRSIGGDTRDQGEVEEPEGLNVVDGITTYAVDASTVALNNGSLNFTNVEKVWIFSTDGTLVASLSRPSSYNVNTLPQGVYLVKMQNGNTIRTQKITIK